MLAEELRVANEELITANEELEQRIAERTAALAEEVAAKEAAVRDRERLMAEVHHQVGNSLQILRSILNLHTTSASDPTVVQQFREAAMRVQAIAAVHNRLYGSEGWCVGLGIRVADYLEGLVRDLPLADGYENVPPIVLTIEPDLTLRADRTVALGLVVTELVTNAVKYGDGKVRIAVRRARPESIEVLVEDDGPGFPSDFDPQRCRSLGMRVVRAYAAKPDGLRIDHSAKGARVIARLPV